MPSSCPRKIVVAGTSGPNLFVARYGATGTRDNGFATNGIQEVARPDGSRPGRAVTIDTNGKIPAAGTVGDISHGRFAVERLLS